MNQPAEIYFTLALIFLTIGIVFVLFVIFHNKKMMQHHAQITEMQLAKSKQDLKDSIAIQESERAKVGSDLHDELGPTLSAVKLKINSIPSGSSLREDELKQLTEMIDQTIVNVRSLSHDLYPNTLKEFGLVDALQELILRISNLTTVKFNSELDQRVGALDFQDQLNLYRIVQEFFNNSLKHGQASEINLKLIYNENDLILELRDNGQGFTPDTQNHSGLGLKNMRMRAESMNASFQINSEKGGGTSLTLQRKS